MTADIDLAPHAAQARARSNGKTSGKTLAETAYRSLRADIMSGFLQPGKPLRLEALRTRYGLSFSPLREALARLQSERLVTAVALKGFSVAAFSLSEMWDAVETRILIECEALRRAIAVGDDDWEATIVAAFHALRLKAARLGASADTTSAADIETMELCHRAFHRALIAASGSPRLLELADTLYVETERYRRPTLIGDRNAGPVRSIVAEHRELMEHVLKRDADAAVTFLGEHYRRTARSVEARLAGAQAEMK